MTAVLFLVTSGAVYAKEKERDRKDGSERKEVFQKVLERAAAFSLPFLTASSTYNATSTPSASTTPITSTSTSTPVMATSTLPTFTSATSTFATSTPALVMSTAAGNTTLGNTFSPNYYDRTGLSEGMTRILKLAGFVAGGIGAVTLLVSAFAGVSPKIVRNKVLTTRFE